MRASFQSEQQSLNDLRTKLIGAALAAALAVRWWAWRWRAGCRCACDARRRPPSVVAGGDLDARIDATGGDEVAAL